MLAWSYKRILTDIYSCKWIATKIVQLQFDHNWIFSSCKLVVAEQKYSQPFVLGALYQKNSFWVLAWDLRVGGNKAKLFLAIAFYVMIRASIELQLGCNWDLFSCNWVAMNFFHLQVGFNLVFSVKVGCNKDFQVATEIYLKLSFFGWN
jgi:hypothetical protein